MPKAPWVIILGAGYAGLTVAKELDNYLKDNPNSMQVVLVDRNHSMTIGKANQFALAGRSVPMQVTSSYMDLSLENVYFVQDEIVSINTKSRTVFGRGHRFKYEKLIVALGAQNDFEKVYKLDKAAYNMSDIKQVMQLKDALADFRRGNIVISVCDSPCIGPTSPYEYALLIKNILEKNQQQQPNLLENTTVTLTVPDDTAYPQQAPNQMLNLLEEADIKFVPKHTPHLVDPKKRTIYYKNGEMLKYDILVAHFPTKAPEVLVDAGMVDDSTGFVTSDAFTLRTNIENVYCLGDCAAFNIPGSDIPHPKAGVFAANQGLVVARDIIQSIEHGDEEKWDPEDGEPLEGKEAIATQIAEVGHNNAIEIEANFYSEENIPLSEVYQVTKPSQDNMRNLIQWWDHLITNWFTQ